jgi:hypothetical protein
MNYCPNKTNKRTIKKMIDRLPGVAKSIFFATINYVLPDRYFG